MDPRIIHYRMALNRIYSAVKNTRIYDEGDTNKSELEQFRETILMVIEAEAKLIKERVK